MNRSYPLLIIVIILLIGCGKSAIDNPIQPADTQTGTPLLQTKNSVQNNRYLWGFWNVRIMPDTGEVEIVPVRTAEMHLNAVRLLEVDPCKSCLNIEDVKLHPGNRLTCRVWIKHPLAPTKDLCAFDVRGIYMTGADYNFSYSNRTVAFGDSISRLLEPDGYTSLFNPTEYPPDPDILPAMRYIPGLYASGGDLTATLNPYYAFAKDAERRIFGNGYPWTMRVLKIYVPDDGPLEFGYAIDACWMPVENVQNPWTDFPPEANSLEAYEIRLEMVEALKPVAGTYAPINIDVLDHQGLETIESVTIEAPQLFGGEVQFEYVDEMPDGAFRFSGNLPNEYGADVGDYPVLIKVTDTAADPNMGSIKAYNIFSVEVTKCWAQTWGGDGTDSGNAVAVDFVNNIYVAGQFSGTADFDPGLGVEEYTAEEGAYITKYNAAGQFEWVRVWGLEPGSSAFAFGACVDGCGYAYITGAFNGTIDFDAGPGVESRTGENDIFLLQLDPDGAFQWVRNWGSGGPDYGLAVATTENGYVYMTGAYTGLVDFDTGTGIDFHTSLGGGDIFLSRFDSAGNFQWARTWGGASDFDYGEGVAVNETGVVYVSGAFEGSVDFDPEPDVDQHTSKGGLDCFMSKFDTDGNFMWALTWGGDDDDIAHAVGAPCTGLAVVAGEFRNSVDFDPGPGEDYHNPPGVLCSFISVFTAEGGFMKCKAWGTVPVPPPASCEPVTSLGVDASGNLYVTGFFSGEVDFDPDGTSDPHEAVGGWDAFISKFDPTGNHIWTRTWGGLEDDRGLGVAVANNGGIYGVGFFQDEVDFNPDIGTDIHYSSSDSDAYLVKYTPAGDW